MIVVTFSTYYEHQMTYSKLYTNTLLIRFFSVNLSDSTSSWDLQALIFPFTTSNYKTECQYEQCSVNPAFFRKQTAESRNFQEPLTMNEDHAYYDSER
jgi:hypothetical protein